MHTCTSADIVEYLNMASAANPGEVNDQFRPLTVEEWETWLLAMYDEENALTEHQQQSIETVSAVLKWLFDFELVPGPVAKSVAPMLHFMLTNHIRKLTGNSLCLDDLQQIVSELGALFSDLPYLPENAVCQVRRLNILGACYDCAPDYLGSNNIITRQPGFDIDLTYCVGRFWLEAKDYTLGGMGQEPEFHFEAPRITADGIDKLEASSLPTFEGL